MTAMSQKRAESVKSQPGLTILDAMADAAIFGPWFDGKSWIAWKAFLRALFGLPMGKTTRSLYQKHTGRKSLPENPSKEAWLVVGRRGGKSLIAALIVARFVTAM
jgi:hypothetical protein